MWYEYKYIDNGRIENSGPYGVVDGKKVNVDWMSCFYGRLPVCLRYYLLHGFNCTSSRWLWHNGLDARWNGGMRRGLERKAILPMGSCFPSITQHLPFHWWVAVEREIPCRATCAHLRWRLYLTFICRLEYAIMSVPLSLIRTSS